MFGAARARPGSPGASVLPRRRRRRRVAAAARRLRHRRHRAPARQRAPQPTAPDKSATDKIVNFSNWPAYIDVDEKTKKYPDARRVPAADRHQGRLHRGHQRQRRVLRQGPAASSRTARTSAATSSSSPTGWPRRLIRLGWVQKLDKAKIPNVTKNLIAAAARRRLGTRTATTRCPWQSGLAGIALQRKDKVDRRGQERRRAAHPPDLKGKVDVLTEMRDTMG